MNGRIPEFMVVEYTQEEYEADMRQKLKEEGLYKAAKEFCDKIEADASVLSYGGHRGIQEYLNDILTLIRLYEEKETSHGKVECCANCKFFHQLKHNFEKGKGYEEAYCCDALMHLYDDKCKPWIQEVDKEDVCESFVKKEDSNEGKAI